MQVYGYYSATSSDYSSTFGLNLSIEKVCNGRTMAGNAITHRTDLNRRSVLLVFYPCKLYKMGRNTMNNNQWFNMYETYKSLKH